MCQVWSRWKYFVSNLSVSLGLLFRYVSLLVNVPRPYFHCKVADYSIDRTDVTLKLSLKDYQQVALTINGNTGASEVDSQERIFLTYSYNFSQPQLTTIFEEDKKASAAAEFPVRCYFCNLFIHHPSQEQPWYYIETSLYQTVQILRQFICLNHQHTQNKN